MSKKSCTFAQIFKTRIMKKKLFTLLLFFVVSCGGFINAEIYSGSCGDNLNWSLNTNTGVLNITGTGAMYDFERYTNSCTIPWYSYRKNVKTVNLPEGLTTIGRRAFDGCSYITQITIPSTVESMGWYAFSSCTRIKSVVWNAVNCSNSLSQWSPFKDAADVLTSFTIGEGVQYISEYLCYDLINVKSVSIPNSVISIGELAFYANSKFLNLLILPSGVTSIGSRAFGGVVNVVYNGTASGSPWGATTVLSGYLENDFLYADNQKLSLKKYLGSSKYVTIPDGVISIEKGAFEASDVISVAMPEGVVSIGESAFSRCTNLYSINIPSTVTYIGENAFYYCISLPNVGGLRYADTYLASVDDTVSSCSIKEGTRWIGTSAFEGNQNLKSVEIPSSVTNIGVSAFGGCVGFHSLTIPNTVVQINYSAFYDVANVIYNGVSTGAPWGAKGLNAYWDEYLLYDSPSRDTLLVCLPEASGDIDLPRSIKAIRDEAFSNCSLITSVVIPEGVEQIGMNTFNGCTAMTSITIPSSMKKIMYGAFFGCLAINQINISDLAAWCNINFESSIVTGSSPVNLYINGSLATDITIPNGITYFSDNAFCGITSIKSVSFSNDLSFISSCAFANCTSLESVNLPNSLLSIGANSFMGCSKLDSIVIPESVMSIGSQAFAGCSSLNKVIMTSTTAPFVYGVVFPANTIIYVPMGTLNDYRLNFSSNIVRVIDLNLTISEVSATSVSISIGDNTKIASCGIEGGAEFAGNVVEYIGLEPSGEYKDIPLFIRTIGNDYDTIHCSFTTTALTLSTVPARLTSESSAILLANTNMSNAETSCGFEFRRTAASDAVPSQLIGCPVANGTMAVKVKNLHSGTEYKYRPFYTSSAGSIYYGEWSAFDPIDAYIDYEPVIYTYAPSLVNDSSAVIKGYALEGSSDFTEQGFEYWAVSRVNNNAAPIHRLSQDAIGTVQTVQVTGISMQVTLTNLDPGTVYTYRTYAKTNGQVIYGTSQTFTTKGEYQDITGLEEITIEQLQMTNKFLIDGHLYIVRPDGRIFNTQGVRVR